MRRECWDRFPRPPRVSDPNMHHGTRVTHVPWCMPGSLTSGPLWSWWRGKRSRHSWRMRNPQFYVSGKRPIARVGLLEWSSSHFICIIHIEYLIMTYNDNYHRSRLKKLHQLIIIKYLSELSVLTDCSTAQAGLNNSKWQVGNLNDMKWTRYSCNKDKYHIKRMKVWVKHLSITKYFQKVRVGLVMILMESCN